MTTLMGYSDARSLGNTSEPRTRGRVATIAVWILQVAAATLFLFAGASKLLGVAVMVQLFHATGLGQWFRYVTGAIEEVVSAILILSPSLAFVGAVALAATMIGAIVTHLFVVGGSALPAIVLLLVTIAVAWMRRPQVHA
jgi:putative oxidoreductase